MVVLLISFLCNGKMIYYKSEPFVLTKLVKDLDKDDFPLPDEAGKCEVIHIGVMDEQSQKGTND